MSIEDDVIVAIPRHVAKRYRLDPVHRHDNVIGVALRIFAGQSQTT